jgi:hypothetical protein
MTVHMHGPGRSLGDGIFFSLRTAFLRTGPDLEFSPFSLCRKNRRIRNHRSKIFRCARSPVSFFLHLGWGRDIFFFVKDRPAMDPLSLSQGALTQSASLFGLPISARMVSNLAAAAALNAAVTPLQLPLALALLPAFRRRVWAHPLVRWMRRWGAAPHQ